MSILSRIANVFRGDRVSREIDEELQSHLEEAIAAGRSPEEARRALGIPLKLREDSRDVRLLSSLDSLRADVIFGVRQLVKNRITAGAAILSLALAIGACTAAFRLIDALLLRPLPVSAPDRLFVVSYGIVDDLGKKSEGDSFEYPFFRVLRSSVKDSAELFAVSYPRRSNITYGSEDDMERVQTQFVSGSTFGVLGLKPEIGRVLTASDDVKPGAHPFAVVSYDYWNRRLGRDARAVGRSFRMGNDYYQIVGVAPKGFTGTEPGTLTDIFVPTMMNTKAIEEASWSWFRIWVQVGAGVSPELVRDKLQAAFRHYRTERAKAIGSRTTKTRLEQYINAPLTLETAAAGFSGLQKSYRRSLYILAAMVGLVLLIACFNVANLMTAQATARGREMALRVSIGAGRGRLVQLMLVESALLAFVSSILGTLFAAWAAPFVVGLINSQDNPARLVLDADWRVTAFAVGLAIGVTFLFGLVPALRASAVKPVSTLRGGEDVHSRHRVMNALVAAQVAFCFVVHFVAGMFIATFDRLANQPTGFSAANLLILETSSRREQPIELWNQITEHLKTKTGVESASLSLWPLMSNNGWSSDIWLAGKQVQSQNPYFLSISPEWLDTMRIELTSGRGFRPSDRSPDVAIVTESFAKQFFNGDNPVGRTFERMGDKTLISTTIVGVVRDVRYRNMREAIRPVAFVPVQGDAAHKMRPKDWGAFVIRTSSDPLALASTLRPEVTRIRPEFRVVSTQTQEALVESHTIRERLLAMLSFFFATVALILAGVGLYGVLNYSVLQRQREIGIRMALGAKPFDVARRVMTQVLGMLIVGAASGLAAGMASESYIETLLYQVTARDVNVIAIPAITILIVAVLAAVPPVLRAVRIDPAIALRAD